MAGHGLASTAREGLPATAEQVQLNINRYWHSTASSYDTHPLGQIHMGAAKELWRQVWRHALPAAPAEILDVGTGTGQVSLLLAELGHRVTGTDLAEGMLEQARAKSTALQVPPTFELGDAVTPDFPPASFDAVTSRYLLWTLREPDRALRNWRALLRPTGRLVAVDANWFEDGIRQDTRDRPDFQALYDDTVIAALPLAETRTGDDAAELVEAAGFVDVEVTFLPEIEQLQRSLYDDPGKQVRLPFRISASAY